MLNDYPDVMSVKQAAEALHICTKSVYRLIKENKIASLNVGRKIIIPKYALIMYLRSAQYTINT